MAAALPWDVHPDLTEQRLALVGSWIAQGRNDAVDRHDPSIGGNAWTLGTCAYANGKFRIEQAFLSGRYRWLGIVDPSNQFIFRIGSVPVRFYRGMADEPTARTLRQAHPELRQLSLMLNEGLGRADLAYRFAIDTHLDGSVAGIKFVGLSGKLVECLWEVPLTPTVALLQPVDSAPADGVELPPPAVRVPEPGRSTRGGTRRTRGEAGERGEQTRR